MEGEPRFAADAMLGTLARWLRLLGFDCFYQTDIDDGRLVELARSQSRVVLTRDRGVARKAKGALFVASDDLDEQLVFVMAAFGLPLPEEPPTTRCSLCNALLIATDPRDLAGSGVPEQVLARHHEFYRCPQCSRVYWKGTHLDSMRGRLARLREQWPRGAPPARFDSAL